MKARTATFVLLVAALFTYATNLSAQKSGVASYGPPAAVQPSAPFWASPRGFGFRPAQDIYLTALGYFVPSSMPYDPTASGVGEYLSSADEDGTLHNLTRSEGPYWDAGSIGAGSGVIGDFVYASRGSPDLLRAGQLYVVTRFRPMQVDITTPGVGAVTSSSTTALMSPSRISRRYAHEAKRFNSAIDNVIAASVVEMSERRADPEFNPPTALPPFHTKSIGVSRIQ